MLEFLNPKICGFGIDLSDLSIKIIRLKKRGANFELASLGRQEINEGLIEEGEIKKEAELIETIKKAIAGVKGKALNTKYCIVSLPETESFVRVVQLPMLSKNEVADALKWELEAHIPLALEEIYYDWQIIGPSAKTKSAAKQGINVLIGVLPKKTVDPYLDVLKKAGLKPYIFEIESIATVRALVKEGPCEETQVIIDLGAKRTSLLISCGQTIYFTTSVSISNNSLVQILSDELGISKEKAKAIKLKVGIDYRHAKSRVFEVFKKPLTELSGQTKNYIDFYHEHILPSFQTSKVNRVLLCGGGANIKGLPEFLSSELELPVEIGNPWINALEDAHAIPGLPFEESLAYTTAFGLALRSHNQQQKRQKQ